MKLWPQKSKRGSTHNRLAIVLVILTLLMFVFAVIAFIHVAQWEAREGVYQLEAAKQRVLAQRIAKHALSALGGDKQAFALLKRSRDEFDVSLKGMEEGYPQLGVPPLPSAMSGVLGKMISAWAELRARADEVLTKQDALLTVGKFVTMLDETVPLLDKSMEAVVNSLVETGASQSQVYQAARQLMLSQRIQNDMHKVLHEGKETTVAIDRFSSDSKEYAEVLQGLLKGNSRRSITSVTAPAAIRDLTEVQRLFSVLNDQANEIVNLTPTILPALNATQTVGRISDRVSDQVDVMIEQIGQSPGRTEILGVKAGTGLVTLLAAMAAIAFLLLIWVLLRDSQQRGRESREQNDRNQQAILRLLDEMGDLADGDLTVEATVTEDITGAIADSVNYTIEALRSLVTTINNTAEQVSSSAQESRAAAMRLAEASDQQAQQITVSSESIRTMAESADNMSKEATQSAEVAQRAVEMASAGAVSVRKTTAGMDNIREQIQETSKRIKRLGESSQEIGDIVELIDDIADQTNILALNAAMQAAMAGEAGRGFAVVADEVQRLAERSGHATKQIEALVKTIQADTSEAVSSMETSTSGVVRVASLAEEAGEALKEIENVSNYIADTTRQIAHSALIQSSLANKINEAMHDVQDISVRVSEGTSQTAHEIGALADMADELQRSVAGFRLPDAD